MEFQDSFKMAVVMLASNKLRTALTMLGMIIGNTSVIGMIGIGQGAQALASNELLQLGPNVMTVSPGARRERAGTFGIPQTLVWRDAEAIAEQVPAVDEVAPGVERRLLVSYRNLNAHAIVMGTTPQYAKIRSFEIDRGRFINLFDLKLTNPIAIIGPDIAERFFPNQNPIGQSIRIVNVSFEVVGVTQPKGSFFGINQDEFIFIPLTTMVNRLVGNTSPYGVGLSWINVNAKDSNSINAAQFQIKNLLRLRHKIQTKEDDFRVVSAKQILDVVNTIAGGLTLLLGAIAGISLIVGGIGVMNIMLVSVSERTQEIGLRKAIGAAKYDILSQFLIEAVIISTVGGAIGIGMGYGVVWLIGTFSPLITTTSPSTVMLSLSLSSGMGLFFGVFPAHKAAELDPIVALQKT